MNTLQFGSKGAQVTELQKKLAFLGFFDESIYGFTDYYGKLSKQAVEAFQKVVGYEVSGIADETTLRAIQVACQAVTYYNSIPKKLYIGNEGVDLIARWEGMVLQPYQDSAGYWTIGIGTRFIDGVEVTQDTPELTEEQAKEIFRKNIGQYENIVRSTVTVQLKQNQFDALVSFAYNLGSLKELGDAVNDGTVTRDTFLQYVYAGGKKLKGLVNRRTAEAELYFR